MRGAGTEDWEMGTRALFGCREFSWSTSVGLLVVRDSKRRCRGEREREVIRH